MTKIHPHLFISAGCLLTGLFLGKSLNLPLLSHANSSPIVRQDGYKYIAPLLRCNAYDPEDSIEQDLKQKIKSLIEKEKNNHSDLIASVYHQDLSTGNRFELNADESYTIASLSKVPLLIAVLKESENDPSFLDKTIIFDGGTDNYNFYYPTNNLIAGNSYTYQSLLDNMIIDSDNTSKSILESKLSPNVIDNLYREMKIENFNQRSSTNVIAYSKFFRVLFNSSFLNNKNSEKALELLTHSSFKLGIASGVPENVTVANKYGEKSIDNSTLKELHDCGIIYRPNNPYLLCIMTRGVSFEKQELVIKNISSLIYNSK